ncbi:tyrosine-protein phosphatase [Arthrobacter globiformis]|uniref:tyrosine-protein phosphatase n=1 Tax=Arthrobacter globiformis TaxID=1665 RepID=UPI0027D88D0E|nr:tyrosine-protein phosphatase [Arthrobacter globiformis]
MTMKEDICGSSDLIYSPLVNLRDLGGLPVAGGRVRSGLLLRSDDVSVTTGDQAAQLVAEGLTTILDLRSQEETRRSGRGPLGRLPVTYHHLPLMPNLSSPDHQTENFRDRTAEGIGRWYVRLLESRAETIVKGLDIIADTRGTVIFHCAGGKDRTGVFAACILTVLGADALTVVTDYARTQESLGALTARLGPLMQSPIGGILARSTGASGGDTATAAVPVRAIMSAAPDNMLNMLSELERRYGGIVPFLKSEGLSDDTIIRLNDRLVRLG